MHEMSLAQGVLDIIEQTAEREKFQRVKTLRLEVGALAGIELHALKFAFDAMRNEDLLAGCEVIYETPKANAWCLGCSTQVDIEQRGEPCPACGSYLLQPTSGTELKIIDLVVLD